MLGGVLLMGYCSLSVGRFAEERQRAASAGRAAPPAGAAAIPAPTPEAGGLRTDLAKDLDYTSRCSSGGFGAVALWDLKITNKSSKWSFADLSYRTNYYSESGAELREHRGTLAIVLKPKEVRRIKEFNDGLLPQQTTKCSFTIYAATAR